MPVFDQVLSVSEALNLVNQTLEAALPAVLIEGEVVSFTISKQKYVFFDLKDENSSLNCFMMVYQLKFPLEDGMRVRVLAQPRLTNWGKFSLTVRELQPVGEGSLKKAFELLKARLEQEGLFDPARKRVLPEFPAHIGVVGSEQSAGWADFLKIINHRFGGLKISLAHVGVQGIEAPNEIARAIEYLNNHEQLDVLVIIRGGGSADDLAAFNHEDVVRAIASSRTPTVVGVGHETDTTLSDLAADVRAATPSNAAQLVVPDKTHLVEVMYSKLSSAERSFISMLDNLQTNLQQSVQRASQNLSEYFNSTLAILTAHQHTIKQLDPSVVLKRGYALVKKQGKAITRSTDAIIGDRLEIKFHDGEVIAEVK